MSLPLFMGIVSTDLIKPAIPYITPEKSIKLDASFQRQKGHKYVGLVWRGNPVPAHRSIPFEQITQLLDLSDIQFVTLQKKLEASEKEILSSYSNVHIYDEQLSDFSSTAAIVNKLDLIITIDSAVAHLAGGLGKECWVLLKDGADWRWNGKSADQTSWYPSMRLFRQDELGNWSGVLDSLLKAVPKWLSTGVKKS
jgi:ADP-heptose:LPS heptosyltransferase